ncbi:hypothetical protein JRQ81_001120 [Phrynocephalus forsythii]|uniref:Uncharacterized protein n=1 Tax=Phrynocephalus forsythii TaxID=171643 RepID=A0A9Q0Y6K6_9SAUR|nr:hypothetical protein JRQ81_001120 [Phrynocephalus forsythii]
MRWPPEPCRRRRRRPGLPSALLGALLWLGAASGHPQCLDFKPPFKPLRALAFCVQYSDFGCCDATRDSALLERYYRVSGHLDQAALRRLRRPPAGPAVPGMFPLCCSPV